MEPAVWSSRPACHSPLNENIGHSDFMRDLREQKLHKKIHGDLNRRRATEILHFTNCLDSVSDAADVPVGMSHHSHLCKEFLKFRSFRSANISSVDIATVNMGRSVRDTVSTGREASGARAPPLWVGASSLRVRGVCRSCLLSWKSTTKTFEWRIFRCAFARVRVCVRTCVFP